MNETVVIALIGVFGTIFVPIVTYYLTSKEKTKKGEIEKKELEKKNTEMILKINEQHKNDLEKNEKENQYKINLIEKDHEHAIRLLKIQTETDIEKANKLETNSSMNEIAANFIQETLRQPNNELSKELNSAMKKKFLSNKR